MLLNRLVPGAPSDGGPIDMAFVGSTADGSNASTYTFSSHSIGAAATDRVVVVVASAFVAGTITGVTIGGVAATQAVAGVNGSNRAEIWYLKVAGGTTADIVVSLSASAAHCGIGVYRYTGGSSVPTVTATVTDATASFSTTMSVAEGGVIVGAAVTGGNAGNRFAFTGVTEDAETDFGAGASGEDFGMGHLEYAAAATPTVGNVISASSAPATAFASFE